MSKVSEIIKSHETIIAQLKTLPADTVIEQYAVDVSDTITRTNTKYGLVVGESNSDPYLNESVFSGNDIGDDVDDHMVIYKIKK